MKKLTYILVWFFATIMQATAQTDSDALRYSQMQRGGTARSMAVGSAVGALGGDLSAISINPAGVAIYRSSEFTLTPSLYNTLSSSGYMGTHNTDGKYNFSFNNIGFVFSALHKDYINGQKEYRRNGWVNSNVAFGFNRLNNFHNRIMYAGINKNNSLIDKYVEDVNSGNGTSLDNLDESYPFTANLAYQTYLIDPTDSMGTQYVRAFPLGTDGLTQQKTITTSGAIDEYYVAFGANYSNRMYFGGSFNFPFLKYREESFYEEESVTVDTVSNFKNYQIREDLYTYGEGFNFKLGMIFRVTDFLRLGGSVQTPTFYNMIDKWSSRVTSDIHKDTYEYESPNGRFSYTLATPFKATASCALIIGKNGFLSADYEIMDYSTARLRSPNYKFFDENNSIGLKYRPVNNIRVGAEWKFQNLSFRGGYALYDSPFKSSYMPQDGGQARTNYSIGWGIRESEYYLDFAYVYSTTNSFHKPYLLADQSTEGASINTNSNNFLVTMGFKF